MIIIIPNILLKLSLLNFFSKGLVACLGEHVVLVHKFCLYRKAAFWRTFIASRVNRVCYICICL